MTTTPTSGAAIQRYKIGYHADEWGQRSSTPSGIPDASGSWVLYADHVTALAAGQATAAQLGAYAALSESFLEIPDVQDESGINTYYSREVVLECIDAALASHGQAPAVATLPEGWVPLTITHEGQYPEEVAYGPQIMMDRLGKWLAKYFAQAAQADSVLYDPKAVLDVFNGARAGSEKPVGYMRGIRAVIAHWESRPEPHRWMVPARADSVREDAAPTTQPAPQQEAQEWCEGCNPGNCAGCMRVPAKEQPNDR